MITNFESENLIEPRSIRSRSYISTRMYFVALAILGFIYISLNQRNLVGDITNPSQSHKLEPIKDLSSFGSYKNLSSSIFKLNLANGVDLLTTVDSKAEICSAAILIPVGLAKDPGTRRGVSGMIEQSLLMNIHKGLVNVQSIHGKITSEYTLFSFESSLEEYSSNIYNMWQTVVQFGRTQESIDTLKKVLTSE